MKLVYLLIFIHIFYIKGYSQEELNYITSLKIDNTLNFNRGNNSFDSSFIYISDTLELPFLDDFSKNHFQKYFPNYSNPTVTSDKRYKLLDKLNQPLNQSSKYTTQQTFRKVFNPLTLKDTNELLPSTVIKIGDFSVYPPIYSTKNVYPPYIIYDTVGNSLADTIWLTEIEFVQDSAIQFFQKLSDLESYWLDKSAEHNYTNASFSWTLGVVTFDGRDENGFPYQYGSSMVDYNDYLTSKPINLANLTSADSVYFSFLFQAGGLNDLPENVDSLLVEFYAPNEMQWFKVWSASGNLKNDFTKVHFRVTEDKFFKKGFQFRFVNYSGVSGGIDQFHIDYVRLQKGSGYQDTLFKDFSIIYPVTSLLQNYTQVPWDHFKSNPVNKTSKAVKISLRNSSNQDENYSPGGLIEIKNKGILDGKISLLGKDLANGDNNYKKNTIYTSYHDISSNYDFKTALAGDFQEFNVSVSASTPFSNLGVNDTCYFTQRFYDVYAYDDGSAEAAYGPTGNQARLAYKFTPFEDDSLIGVKMKFVESVKDVSENLFLMSVWSDNNGKPGTLLYEDDFLNPRTPIYHYDDSLGFRNYYFKDFIKLPIKGSFYVGWRQLDQASLNIGFDRNTKSNDKIFFSVDNGSSWINSNFEGSLLIRPIFSTNLNRSVGVSELNLTNNSFNFYPNPSTSILNIETDDLDYGGIELLDINGKTVIESQSKTINIAFLENGMYFLKNKKDKLTYKLIKN